MKLAYLLSFVICCVLGNLLEISLFFRSGLLSTRKELAAGRSLSWDFKLCVSVVGVTVNAAAKVAIFFARKRVFLNLLR